MKIFSPSVFLAVLILSLTVAHAQESGRVIGLVLDKVSEEPLPGANILLEGTTIGAASDLNGEYLIPKVSPGSYNLVVKYIGYKEINIPINVKPGESVYQLIELEYVAIKGEAIVVTAQAEGQIEAINQQLASNTIKNVVSAARIQDVPDANAAESIGRLPGISIVRDGGEGQKVTIRGMAPKYNVMMVNSVRMQSTDRDDRSVDLNMIPPNILSGIEVTKALTADMDADAVGGVVNLKIGKAKEGFRSNFSLQGGYGSLANTYGNYRGTGLLSTRFFDGKLGVQVSGFLDSYNRNSDKLTAKYELNERSLIEEGLTKMDLKEVTINDKVTDRQRMGGGLILDYQFSNGSLILNNFISSLHQDQIEQQNFLNLDYGWTGYAKDTEFNNTVISNALQGEFDFFNINMDFSLSNSISTQRIPGELRLNIGSFSGGANAEGWASDSLIAGKEKSLSPSVFLNNIYMINQRKIKDITTLTRDVDEAAQAAVLNFNTPFNFTNYLSGKLKFGGKYVRNTRKNDETQRGINLNAGVLALPFNTLLRDSIWTDLGIEPDDPGVDARLLGDENYDIGDFLAGKEGVSSDIFYNKLSIWKMNHLQDLAKENHFYSEDLGREVSYYLEGPKESSQYDYNYTRDFYAFYIMTELNLGKYVTLFPGIRYEKFAFDYEADSMEVYDRMNEPGQKYFRHQTIHWDSTKGENWFPQMQMRIKPTDWLDVRLASTKSIIYPDYRAVSPYLYADTYAGLKLELGNPYLKPALTQNYDIYTSVYENHIGLFTVGFFYKEIDNLIVKFDYKTKGDPTYINNRFPLSTTEESEIKTWINLEETSYVKGIELDWQTHFWYLPSFLHGAVFNINYTHINSESRYPYFIIKETGSGIFKKIEYSDTTRTGRLINQPSDILNVTLGYDIGDFSARLSFLYQDNVLKTADPSEPELDSYTAAYYRWDFTAYQNLPWYEGLQLYLNINNITNRPDREFRSVLERLSVVEYYGQTADFGIRYIF